MIDKITPTISVHHPLQKVAQGNKSFTQYVWPNVWFYLTNGYN